MTDDRVLSRLEDMRDAIDAIAGYMHGKTFDDYRGEPMMRDAVGRNIERLSEASRHLPEDLKARHGSIPWRQIADIGNVLRHAYRKVNDRTIWETVELHLPPLAKAVRNEIAGLEGRTE